VRAAVGLGDSEVGQRNATRLDIIDEPRSAWMVSWSRVMPCLRMVSANNRSARIFDSREAINEPTTYRESMSKITYR